MRITSRELAEMRVELKHSEERVRKLSDENIKLRDDLALLTICEEENDKLGKQLTAMREDRDLWQGECEDGELSKRVSKLEGLLRETKEYVECAICSCGTCDSCAMNADALEHELLVRIDAALAPTAEPELICTGCGIKRGDPHQDDCPVIFGGPNSCETCGGSMWIDTTMSNGAPVQTRCHTCHDGEHGNEEEE